MRRRRAIVMGLGGVALAPLAWLILAMHPQPLFAYEARAANVVLHARAALPPEATTVLADVVARVTKSPLYEPTRTVDVFLCDSFALFGLLAATSRGSGLTNPWQNVFIVPSIVAHDRILERTGGERAGERTLAYTIAHEVTHAMTMARVGFWQFHKLAPFQVEGYADYVGGVRAGPYQHYRELVAFLLEERGYTVDQLLAARLDRATVDSQLTAASRP